jgi:cytoskeletal protein CcmA (bactofilin family)
VTLGARDRLVGRLHIDGDLRVQGMIEGEVEATGLVDVAEAATVKATVTAREVGVSGQVNGPVTASEKLVIERTGALAGDVRVPRLVIRDGATLNGVVTMSPPAGAPPKSKAKPA